MAESYNDGRKREKFNYNSHRMRKRNHPRLPRRNIDIYITNKSNFQSDLAQCTKLLDSGEKEIVIHGLGAAVAKTVNLALQLREKYPGTVELSVNTSTVDLVDDFEPLDDQGLYDSQSRQNSAVHIRVYHVILTTK